MSVDDNDIGHYHAHGYVIIRGLIPTAASEKLLERIDGLLDGRYPAEDMTAGSASDNGPDDPGRLIKQVLCMRFPIADPVLETWRLQPALQSAAAALLGSEHVDVFQQQALVKEPGDANATPWHQDDHYWQLDRRGATALTAWTPLLPATAANGTMWLMPGSHRQRVYAHRPADDISKFQTIAEPFDESKLIPLELEPGDVSFHHKNIVHGSFANSGSARRVAIAQHYCTAPQRRSTGEAQ